MHLSPSRLRRGLTLAALGLLAGVAGAQTTAAAWPSKTVRLLVGFPPGHLQQRG